MKKNVFFLAIAIMLFNVAYSQTPLTVAVDFTKNDIHGQEIHLFDILDNGQYVVIDFFYVTCTPCQQISPILNQSYNDFGCNDADVFFMSVNNGDTNEECLEYEETYGMEFPTISGIEGGGNKVVFEYQITSFPTVILIAPDREIIEQGIWPIDNIDDINVPISDAGCNYAECPSGIAVNELPDINIFPNPSNGHFQIEFNQQGNQNVQIINMLGSKLFDEDIKVHNEQFNFEIDIENIPEGIYFILIKNDEQIISKRMTIVY